MATITGTNGDNTYLIIANGTYEVDGLAGYDIMNFGIALSTSFTITKGSGGLVHVDSISGASVALRMTLKNFEEIRFNRQTEVIDLATLFGDTEAPTLSSSSPGNQASGVAADSNIVLSFSEPVTKGSGTLALRDAGGKQLASWDIASSPEVSVDGNTLVLNPSTDLPAGQSLRLELPAGAVQDSTGNALAAASILSFSTAANTSFSGTAGNDVFNASTSGGQFSVAGGGGIDLLALGQARASFALSRAGNGYNLSGGSPAAGYTLSEVERLQFSDTRLALDLSGHAGQTAKVLGAVFGAASVSNAGYVGIGLQLLDSGTSYEALMKLALEFRLGPNASHGAVVDLLYTNVVGVAPDATTKASFVALLDNGTYNPASLGVLAADTSLNAAQINLVGLSDTGLPYV